MYHIQVKDGKTGDHQKVKILGDGAKISRVSKLIGQSNYIVISFALFNNEKEVMSCKGKLLVSSISFERF